MGPIQCVTCVSLTAHGLYSRDYGRGLTNGGQSGKANPALSV